MPLIFLLVPVGFLIFFLSANPQSEALASLPWVPELGIYFSFSLTPLSLFMGLLIATIGALITFFATRYMKNDEHQYRFWTFFVLFTLSMLGLVLSENLISLFLFWEATSICSYFLIGHYFQDEEARKSAFNSLLVTGGGGILLLVGFIGIGALGGSYEISELMLAKEALLAHPLIGLPLVCVLIGVMTKSAQFPFHFWLPQAMTGPAPVSAFLHSATMVKAGVFLLARLFPLFSELPYWEPVLTAVGLTTFLWGGVVAIRHYDLKGVLANTTISALGCLVALIGMAKSYPQALEAFLLFFLAHAFYKAALFMAAGVIEEKYNSKDLRQIRMTFGEDPLLSFAIVVAALSMMGLPPAIGFIAKETFLDFSLANGAYLLPLWLGGLLNFVAAGRILYHLFFAKTEPTPLYNKSSTQLMSLAPFLLGVGTLAFSFLGPAGLNDYVARFVSFTGEGSSAADVRLWHGFNLPLLLSAASVLVGSFVVLALRRVGHGIEDRELSSFSPTLIYERVMQALLKVADQISGAYQSGYLRRYFLIIFSASALLILMGLLVMRPEVDYVNTPIHFVDVCIGLIIVFATLATLVTESKIWAVTQMGVVGTCLILMFIFYGAPDLALTQLLVEIFTLTIFVFALHRLPRLKFFTSVKIRMRDLGISLAFGVLMGYLTYFSLSKPLDKTVAGFYAENAFVAAQGKNIVNVILVDFRSFDTLGEVSVVLMAAIGVYILMRKRGEPT